MKHKTSQILYAYWNEVRGGRLAPRRFDIEPARIASILAETMILELGDGGSLRFRLAGTRITEHLAADLRGQNFLDLWRPQDEAAIRDMVARMTRDGAVGLAELNLAGPRGESLRFEALLLPLVHTRNVIDRFLGTMSCQSLPYWLGAERPAPLELIRTELIWPEGRPHAIAAGMQEPLPLAVPPGAGRIVRHDRRQFRVLDGGRAEGEPNR